MTTRHRIQQQLSTGLFALVFGASGVANLAHLDPVIEPLTHLGYPAYLATLLGSLYLGAALTVVVPGLLKLKELAYAGAAFAMTGAAFSHVAAGDAIGEIVSPLFMLALVLTAYVMRETGRAPSRGTASKAATSRLAPAAG